MQAKPVNLAAYRAARPAEKAKPRARKPPDQSVPIVVTAHPGAVAIVIGAVSSWLPPRQAIDLGRDLIRLAEIAHRGRSRG